jgi:hypothetical protein
MVEFILNSAILRSGKNPKACAEGVAKMLTSDKIKASKLSRAIAVLGRQSGVSYRSAKPRYSFRSYGKN